MKNTVRTIIIALLVYFAAICDAQAQPKRKDTATLRLERSIASLDSLVNAMSSPDYWNADKGSPVKPGDKKDGGVVFWVDGTGKHGLIAYAKDLGIIKWDAAVQKCKDLGPGWHLATKDELDKLYKSKLEIVASFFFFQSATEAEGGTVWIQSLGSGNQKTAYKNHDASTCAVRSF